MLLALGLVMTDILAVHYASSFFRSSERSSGHLWPSKSGAKGARIGVRPEREPCSGDWVKWNTKDPKILVWVAAAG